MDQYAMYLRKSRADLQLQAIGEEETLARHKAILTRLAEKRSIPMSCITVYHELVSGDSIDHRPQMQQLLSDVFEGKYKGVLVVEVQRLARGNTRDQGEVAQAFQYSKTLIITPAKVYDPTNEFDEEYFEFGLFMSRRQYKTIRRRLETGKRESVSEGNYLSPTPPYGYTIVRRNKHDRFLVPDPDQARIVRMIFNWYTEDGHPTYWIASQLNHMGIPSIRSGEWTRASIRNILLNKHYIGLVSWGKQCTVKQKDKVTGKTVKKRSSSGTPQTFQGKHEPIITQEQFAKAASIYGSKAPVKQITAMQNPLSGLLICAHCGRAILYQSYPDRPSRYHHPYTSKCKLKSIHADDVLTAIVTSLKSTLHDTIIKSSEPHTDDAQLRHRQQIESLEAQLLKQQKRKRRLMDEWDSDECVYTRQEFIERKTMYQKSIEDLESAISAARSSAPSTIDYASITTSLHSIIDCLTDPSTPAESKNAFLKGFISKITITVTDRGRGKGADPTIEVFLK